MHVFLTGDRQVGKSWAVGKVIESLGMPCRGFCTRFLTEERGGSALYMVPPEDRGLTDEAHRVAVPEDGRMRAVPGRFDTLGVQLLREARNTPGALIVMDECGFLERDARLFQEEIRRCLDGDKPVLGVLRRDQPWHDFIGNHPRVRVITVTVENREDVPGQAKALLELSWGRYS